MLFPYSNNYYKILTILKTRNKINAGWGMNKCGTNQNNSSMLVNKVLNNNITPKKKYSYPKYSISNKLVRINL